MAAVLLIAVAATATPVASPRRRHKPSKPAAAAPQPKVAAAPVEDGIMHVTTSSSEARARYQAGVVAWENLQTARALDAWREAVQLDSKFAAAHALLAYASLDPAEQARERDTAKALASQALPAEQLLISWLAGVREDRYVDGIAAMNDLLELCPADKHLQLWAGAWLFRVNEFSAAQKRLEKAVALDPNYSAALNELGYAYAAQGDFARAADIMQRYVVSLPGEPNPEDSLAEILRMSAHYEEALAHYRKALEIDPRFHSSQLGIADTYSLMGQQRKAREEYFKARVLAPDKSTELSDVLQSSLTYVRDRDVAGADQAFVSLAQKAHKAAMAQFEAEAWRYRALLQMVQSPSDLVSVAQQRPHHTLFGRNKPANYPEFEDLEQAEHALKQDKAIAESDRQDEYALLLRVRVEAESRRGHFAEAQTDLEKLQAMAAASKSSVVAHACDGAAGALLAYHDRWGDAVSYLERDQNNVFSLFRLAVAYQSVGDLQSSQLKQAALTSFNLPTPEQSFLLPALRARILTGHEFASKRTQ
jgi:tetratricopeptide (TPR) repeat protein